MTQINYPFGDTLEFSCTVEDGEIVSQELVTSGSDAFVSFKLDRTNHLDPDELESIAGQIRQAQTGGKLERASDDEASVLQSTAKSYFKDHAVLKDAGPGVIYALVEYLANAQGLTVYDDAVTAEPSRATDTVVASETGACVGSTFGSLYDKEDDEDDEDWDDEDDYDEEDDEEFDDDVDAYRDYSGPNSWGMH